MAEKISWPHWMPRPQSPGYTIQPTDRRAKSDMEIGGILRNEFDTDETKLNCRMILDQEESAFLEAFEKQILKTGTKWFEMTILVGGFLKTHLVRFAEHPKVESFIGLHSVYSMSLHVSKRSLLPEWMTEIFMKYSPKNLRRWSTRLHKILHKEIPGTLIVPKWGE